MSDLDEIEAKQDRTIEGLGVLKGHAETADAKLDEVREFIQQLIANGGANPRQLQSILEKQSVIEEAVGTIVEQMAGVTSEVDALDESEDEEIPPEG